MKTELNVVYEFLKEDLAKEGIRVSFDFDFVPTSIDNVCYLNLIYDQDEDFAYYTIIKLVDWLLPKIELHGPYCIIDLSNPNYRAHLIDWISDSWYGRITIKTI